VNVNILARACVVEVDIVDEFQTVIILLHNRNPLTAG